MGTSDPVTVVKRNCLVQKRLVTVTATLTTLPVSWWPEPIPHQYLVTSSTGFRATFHACARDLCLSSELEPCPCRGERDSGSMRKWLDHSRNHCHEWHDGKIIGFVDTIIRSCTSARRTRAVGAPRGSYHADEYVPCPSWPIERCPWQPGGVRFTDGRDRPLDYGFNINAYTVEDLDGVSQL